MLIAKLNTANLKLATLVKKSPDRFSTEVNKFKYAIVKKGLDEIIEDLDKWQKMFDPSWFLILMISNPLIDQQLDRNGPDTSVSNLSTIRDLLKDQPTRRSLCFSRMMDSIVIPN